MPAPYSIDLRQKIVESYINQEGSLKSLATRFKVSYGFIKGLIKRYKTTGNFEPLPHGGGHPGKIHTVHEEFIKQQLQQQNDLTLEQLGLRLKEHFDLNVSSVALHQTIQDLGISRKKKLFMIPKNMKNKI